MFVHHLLLILNQALHLR